jgi:micrococcal nuclease
MKIIIPVIALLFQSSAWAHSVDQDFTVAEVLDGQTVRLKGERSLTCRLHGIVAPVKQEAHAAAAAASLTGLADGEKAHVHVINTVAPNVLGCRVFIRGKDLGREQLARGMAWKYRRSTMDANLLSAEKSAKARRLGVWSDPGFVPPP